VALNLLAITESDLPALYRAADSASATAQDELLFIHKANPFLLIFAALLAHASPVSTWLAAASAMLFLMSLAATGYAEYFALQRRWYQSRALAESVKTTTWRLMMGADPFARLDEQKSLLRFRNLLAELLQQNRGIGEYLAGDISKGEQVTEKILTLMRAPFDAKRTVYLRDRIEDQRTWYQDRAQQNKESSRFFLGLLVCCYGCAIALLLVRVASPLWNSFPIGVMAVAASSVISWRQIRRFDELASAYGLTSHELGIVKTAFGSVESTATLGAFVSDAENAFSREHTQWAARRDH
jgi:hypothetical protein